MFNFSSLANFNAIYSPFPKKIMLSQTQETLRDFVSINVNLFRKVVLYNAINFKLFIKQDSVEISIDLWNIINNIRNYSTIFAEK